MAHRTGGADAPPLPGATAQNDREDLAATLEATRAELARARQAVRERDLQVRVAQAALKVRMATDARRSQELADGRSLLAHSLQVAGVATWSVDLNSRRMGWSPNAHEIFCLPPEAPLDTMEGFFSQLVEEDALRLQALAEGADRGEEIPLEWEYRICGRDGTTRWFASRGKAGADPHAVMVSGVTFDITERRQLEAQLRDREQMLTGLVGASPDGIVVSGLGGRIRFASDGIFDVIGRLPEDLVDRHTWEFIDRELHDTLIESTSSLLTDPQGIRQARLRLIHARGHVVTVDCRFRLLSNVQGDADGFVVMVRDVTDQAALEAELARARDQAEAANRAKSDYLSRMSHELRTPMNSVLGFAQLLELSDLAPPDRDSVDRILGAGRHLLQLIDDVLDIARVESGQFTISLAPVSVEDVVTAAADLLQPQLTDASLQLSLDVCERTRVVADPKRLSQVLINLLSNAIKYNCVGGDVAISCSQPETGWYRLSVSDTGEGIPDELLPQLFGAFERLGADRTEVPGTGLGLALSRTLMEAMGGRIGCDSVLGAGSTFWLDLPAADPEHPPADPDTAATSTAGTALASTMRTT